MTSIAAMAGDKLADDGWIMVARKGEFPWTNPFIRGDQIMQVVDDVALQKLAASFHAPLLIDFDHLSSVAGNPTAAAGWAAAVEIRGDALYAKVRWSNEGRRALDGATYRHVSPVFDRDSAEFLGDQTGSGIPRYRVTKLLEVGLTNMPRMKELVPLWNRATSANQMERMPGYVGRDERHDRYERVQRLLQLIRSGHEPAEEHLLSEDEIVRAFAEIVVRYNADPQEGRLRGLSPDEAWQSFQASEPRQRFDHRTAWILAHDARKVRVGRNGITIRIGKRAFNYKGEATGRFQGEQVIARFNPSCPEVLPFQPLGRDEIHFAEFSPETPAFGAGETFDRNERLIDAHNSYARRRYHIVSNSLPDRCFRVNLVDYRTAETGRRIDLRQKSERLARERKRTIAGAAQEIGMAIRSDSPISERRIEAAQVVKQMLQEDSP